MRVGWDGEAFIAAPAKPKSEMREAIEHRGARGVVAAVEDESEQPARPQEVAREDLMAGAGGQSGVQHLRHARLLGEPLGDGQRALLMLGEAHAHGAQAPAAQIGVVGAGDLAQLETRVAQGRPVRGRGGHRSQHRVRMADDIFGAGQHRQVDTFLDCGQEQRRRPGIVEDRRDPAILGDRDDGGNVLHLECQRAGAFEEDGLGRRADQLGDACSDQRIVEARRDPHPREQAGRQPARRVIGAVDQQQFVAR